MVLFQLCQAKGAGLLFCSCVCPGASVQVSYSFASAVLGDHYGLHFVPTTDLSFPCLTP